MAAASLHLWPTPALAGKRHTAHGTLSPSQPCAPVTWLLPLHAPARCVWRAFYAAYLDIYSFGKLSANARSREQDMRHFADSLRGAMLLSLACCAVLQVGRDGARHALLCCAELRCAEHQAGWVARTARQGIHLALQARSLAPAAPSRRLPPVPAPAQPGSLPPAPLGRTPLPAAAGRSGRGGAAGAHGVVPARAGTCSRRWAQLSRRRQEKKQRECVL